MAEDGNDKEAAQEKVESMANEETEVVQPKVEDAKENEEETNKLEVDTD